MPLFEGKTPAERNKTIVALVLPAIALVLLLRMFFGGDDAPRPSNANRAASQRAAAPAGNGTSVAPGAEDIQMPSELPPIINVSAGREPTRNIFGFYVPPAPPPPTPGTPEPTPTPTPTPPLLLSSVSPANVYARTADFTLEVSGDKFTPQSKVYVEAQELQTSFIGPQRLSARVPAALITAQGARAVAVRTPDGQLYSNTATVNVMAPPTPQVTFIGLLGGQRYNDKAIVKPPGALSEMITLQRGDILGARFKVVSISDRAIEFVDTQLNIKHTVPFTDAKAAPGSPAPRVTPPPRTAEEDDDEP
jgi:hypothetical protein